MTLDWLSSGGISDLRMIFRFASALLSQSDFWWWQLSVTSSAFQVLREDLYHCSFFKKPVLKNVDASMETGRFVTI